MDFQKYCFIPGSNEPNLGSPSLKEVKQALREAAACLLGQRPSTSIAASLAPQHGGERHLTAQEPRLGKCPGALSKGKTFPRPPTSAVLQGDRVHA